MDISVIICTYNGERRLLGVLEALLNQRLTGISFELILVDNNSTDNSASLTRDFWLSKGSEIPLRIVVEHNPGLAGARKKGVLNAAGNFIIFCDDDNILCEFYLQRAFDIMISNGSIGVLGGRAILGKSINPPFWFPDFQAAYAVGVQALDSGEMKNRSYVWGAGMCLRRKVLLDLYASGFENILNGRTETNASGGEDVEICYWHKLIGFKIWYDEHLVLFHEIQINRLNKNYLKKLQNASQDSTRIIYYYNLVEKFFDLSLSQKFRFFVSHLFLSFRRNKSTEIIVGLFLCVLRIAHRSNRISQIGKSLHKYRLYYQQR